MRSHWEERYKGANLPWDSGITPPEVVSFWQSDLAQALPRRAKVLDIGCGTGTNLAYFANLGHDAVGVELSGNALDIAIERHEELSAKVRGQIAMIHGSAASIPIDSAHFDYILDIGCLHGVPTMERSGYARGILANLRRGGYYHLYGFDRVDPTPDLERTEPDKTDQERSAESWRGLGADEVERLLGPTMEVVSIEQAIPSPNPCRWYLFRRI